MRRESEILADEVETVIRRAFSAPSLAPQVAEAVEVTRRYLDQAALASRRALERTRRAQRSTRER